MDHLREDSTVELGLIPAIGSSSACARQHIVPDFYGVYLLRSKPKPKLFYIGSTPLPERRFKQHNGQLVNGAYRTKRDGFRPWEMIIVVSGFPSKISALQFEHAFQHPHITRHILSENRLSKTARSGVNSLDMKLGNLRLLLLADYFRSLSLLVNIIDDDALRIWQSNKYHIEVDVNVQIHDSFDAFLQSIDSRKSYIYDIVSILKENLLEVCYCTTCQGRIDFLPETMKQVDLPLVTMSTCCKEVHHLVCILNNNLIPRLYTCSCKSEIPWIDLVQISTKVRQYFDQ